MWTVASEKVCGLQLMINVILHAQRIPPVMASDINKGENGFLHVFFFYFVSVYCFVFQIRMHQDEYKVD